MVQANPQVAQGFYTQINASAGDIGALAGTVERLVSTANSAITGMRANFGTDDQKAQARANLKPGAHRGDNPNAGQVTASTIEEVARQKWEDVKSGFQQGRTGQAPTASGVPAGMPTVQNVRGGGGDSGGNAPPPGNSGGGPTAAAIGAAVADALGGGNGDGGGAGGGGGGGGSSSGATTPGGYSGKPGGAAVSMVDKFMGMGIVGQALKATDEWHSQSAKNDYYRNIEGGTVGNAMGERAREEMYATQTMGVFSGEEASQAIKGVTRMGYTNRTDQRPGTQRKEALDYVYDAKKSRGQSVEEGLQQVAVASGSLHVSLKNLQQGMEAVSESAGKAGVNTEMARKQMIQLMEMGIQKGMGGGAVGVAAAVAQTTASGGKAYAQGTDNAGMFTNSMMYRMAAQSGKTPMQISNLARTDPTAWTKIQGEMQKQGLASAGVTPDMRAWIKEQIGDSDIANDPSEAERIAGLFLEEFDKQIDPVAFCGVIQQLTGKNFGSNTLLAAQYLVMDVAGETDSTNAAKAQGEMGKTDLEGKNLTGPNAGKKNASVSSSLEKFNELTGAGKNKSGRGGRGKDGQSKAAKSYSANAAQTGERERVLESLLQDESLQGESGDKTHVKVTTGEGTRIVTLEEAMKSYKNQVASGQVTFVDGEARGKTVADITGGTDTSEATKAGAKTESSAAATEGAVKTKDWTNLHGDLPGAKKKEEGEGGGGTIGLSDEAKRWFTYDKAGGPINEGAATGTPPAENKSGRAGNPRAH